MLLDRIYGPYAATALSVAALLLGLCGLLPFVDFTPAGVHFWGPLLAIPIGHVARQEARQVPSVALERIALVGLVFGYLVLIMFIGIFVLAALGRIALLDYAYRSS